MPINIPTKDAKFRSQLIDGIRILAWQEYKVENKEMKSEQNLSGLDLYHLFVDEWNQHEIHKMNLVKVKKFISDLGYSESDLAQLRTEYYRNRNGYQNGYQNHSVDSVVNEKAPF